MRSTAGERVWGAAVRLVRTGAVQGVSASTDEVHLKVRGRHSPNPHDVFLYPVDVEWDCDCDLQASPCLHACAGAIAFHEGAKQGEALPEPVQAVHCGVRYDFVREEGRALSVHRVLIYADGREEPVRGPLLESEVILPRQDHHADRLLSGVRVGSLAGETLRKLLVFLEGQGQATLDGRPVSLHLRFEYVEIAPGAERGNLEAPGERVDDVQRARADGARRAEDRQTLHAAASSANR